MFISLLPNLSADELQVVSHTFRDPGSFPLVALPYDAIRSPQLPGSRNGEHNISF